MTRRISSRRSYAKLAYAPCGLRRGEGLLREPIGGLRHAVGPLRRTEGGGGEI